MPVISVIINCLNGERYLKDTLDSVFAQTYSDWEIIFWDNGSTDATGEIAKSYGDKVRYFRSEITTELSTARNLAFARAEGDYFAIIDADDIWYPEKLERQLEVFRSDSDVGLVYCDSMLFDSGGDRYRHFQAGPPKSGNVFGDLLAGNFIFTSTMMYSRSALDSLDYWFDERYTRVADYELSLRVAYRFKIDYADQLLCKWRMFQDHAELKEWKKSLVNRAVEVRDSVEHLIELHPCIAWKYVEELTECYIGIDYHHALMDWERGDSSMARRYLSRHLKNKKFLFVYLCTYLLSYEKFQKYKTIYRNNVTGRK